MSKTTITDENTTDNEVAAPVRDAEHDIQLVPAEIAEEAPERKPSLAIRHVIERQLVASQEVSSELLSTATDVTAAVAEAIAKVFTAVGGGATLPAAVNQTNAELQEFLADAGSRARSAIGDYVGGRAALPNAVVAGAAELAGSAIRAQGGLASAAVNSAFDLATVAALGGDVRATLGGEFDELRTAAEVARGRVTGSASAARQGIRDAATVGDVI